VCWCGAFFIPTEGNASSSETMGLVWTKNRLTWTQSGILKFGKVSVWHEVQFMCILKFGKRHKRSSSPRINLDYLNLEYRTNRLSRNVGNKLPNSAASGTRRLKTSFTLRRNPDISLSTPPFFESVKREGTECAILPWPILWSVYQKLGTRKSASSSTRWDWNADITTRIILVHLQ